MHRPAPQSIGVSIGLPIGALGAGLMLCLGALAGCRANKGGSALAPPPDLDRVAQAALRRLFPELQGPIDRERLSALIRAEAERPAAPGSPRQTQVRDEAICALRAGDYSGARNLLAELLTGEEVERARAVLAAGDQRKALALLDETAKNAPNDAALLSLRGSALFAVGQEDHDPGLVEAALADRLGAARATNASADWIGASQAARWLGRAEPAFEYAQSALAARRSEQALEHEPSRTAPLTDGTLELELAQAGLDALAAAEKSGAPHEALLQARRAARTALERRIGALPEDPWAWQALVRLLEEDERPHEAQLVCLRGLRFAPGDETLHERLAALAMVRGGRAELIGDYEEFARVQPEVALGAWYPAVAHFENAVAALGRREDARKELTLAEALFLRTRTLEARYTDACHAYEADCRNVRGWCALQAGELEEAQRSFLASEDMLKGALLRSLPGGSATGLSGLDQVGTAWARGTDDPTSIEALDRLDRAGKIYEYLHEYQPENVNWANNAGYFVRDTAVALERKARAQAEKGKLDEANAMLSRARELMEHSWRAYVDAARLAPDDARIANDTGLILTYYLQRDVDTAEMYLKRAVTLGEAQLPELNRKVIEAGLAKNELERRRTSLEEVQSALGDAYQNLGVLELTLRGDARAAETWFDKSVKLGPDPRLEITGKGAYLEQCHEALAGKLDPKVKDKSRWGAPLHK